MTVQTLKRRFDELLVQLDEIERTKKFERSALGGDGNFVDDNLLLGWRVKARNQLSRACGAESEHYRQFESIEKVGAPTMNSCCVKRWCSRRRRRTSMAGTCGRCAASSTPNSSMTSLNRRRTSWLRVQGGGGCRCPCGP